MLKIGVAPHIFQTKQKSKQEWVTLEWLHHIQCLDDWGVGLHICEADSLPRAARPSSQEKKGYGEEGRLHFLFLRDQRMDIFWCLAQSSTVQFAVDSKTESNVDQCVHS